MPSGAYYLAGLAIELAIKVCIAKQFKELTIPDKRLVDRVYSHDPSQLIKVAGLEPALLFRIDESNDFRANWDIVRSWTIDRRYQLTETTTADEYLKATSDPENGIFAWIRDHW